MDMNYVLELKEAGHNYLRISNDLGGPIFNGTEHHMSYGDALYRCPACLRG